MLAARLAVFYAPGRKARLTATSKLVRLADLLRSESLLSGKPAQPAAIGHIAD
jgi:hypothetical protein